MGNEADWSAFEKKKKRAALLVAMLNGARDFWGLDPLFRTDFVRDFSSVTALQQDRDYLRPQEVEDEDEVQLFKDLSDSFVADTTDLDENAALQADGTLDPTFVDPHWGHTTGHLCGRLEIDALGWLHPDLRVGLFRAPGTYKIYARPNYLYDPDLPIAVNRMSLKLRMPEEVPNIYEGTAHELDLLMSEGLPPDDPEQPDGQGFFFRDARQLLMANQMKSGLWSLAEVLFDSADAEVCRFWRQEIFETATDMLYKSPQSNRTWDCKWYYSAGPYALGDGAMKFALEPHDNAQGEKIRIFRNPAQRHAAAFEEKRETQADIKFDLKLQIATDDAIPAPQEGDPPKCVMAAEYTDLPWDTRHARFKRIGTLTLKPHDVDPSERDNLWHSMKFSAFNTYHETRPIGQLFRARRNVHKNHRIARLSHSFGESLSADMVVKCPFHN
ncbi:hypothetical protein [uncultured Ruegeria sp.]|uniref:hypothetical protein n=1 Tax=uncultured Ruegeria sp. TaxID=259304 RepID=UPI0026030043|nr:hypothetical protein [uncultured Ruegeria sp.]